MQSLKPRPFKFRPVLVPAYDGIYNKLWPSTLLSDNEMALDRFTILWLVEGSVNGRNFVIPSYASTLVLRKELKWSRLKYALLYVCRVKSAHFVCRSLFYGSCNIFPVILSAQKRDGISGTLECPIDAWVQLIIFPIPQLVCTEIFFQLVCTEIFFQFLLNFFFSSKLITYKFQWELKKKFS